MERYELNRPKLIDVVFPSSEVKHFAIDIAYGDVVPIIDVYRSFGLDPMSSNAVQALDKRGNQQNEFQYYVHSLGSLSLAGNVSDFIWSNLISFIPPFFRSSDDYLSYEVPKSLGGIMEEKVNSLFFELDESRKTLSFGSSGKNIEGYFNYFMPVSDSYYFLSFRDSEVIIKKREDDSFSGIRNSFGLEFVDQVLIAYLADFADKEFYDYIVKMEHLLEIINDLKSDGVKKSEVWKCI